MYKKQICFKLEITISHGRKDLTWKDMSTQIFLGKNKKYRDSG